MDTETDFEFPEPPEPPPSAGEPTPGAILSEAAGAHSTAREVLELLSQSGDGAGKLEAIVALLGDILTSLTALHGKIDGLCPSRPSSSPPPTSTSSVSTPPGHA